MSIFQWIFGSNEDKTTNVKDVKGFSDKLKAAKRKLERALEEFSTIIKRCDKKDELIQKQINDLETQSQLIEDTKLGAEKVLAQFKELDI